jgi:hypothetical protein
MRTPAALIIYLSVVQPVDEVLKQSARLGFCVHASFLSVDGVVTNPLNEYLLDNQQEMCHITERVG